MIKIKVNDVQYKLPESFDEITVGQQVEIARMKDRDEDFRQYHMIHVYTGIPIELIKRMNISQFEQIIDKLSFLSEAQSEINQSQKPVDKFDFKGHTYYLADSLLRGQTQDYLSVQGVMKKYEDNPSLALPYIIAIVAKRQGETLDDFDVHVRAQEFLDLPYSVGQKIWFFFALTARVLQTDIQSSLEVQDKAIQHLLNSAENTLKKSDGQGLSKRMLKTILLFYIRSTSKSWKSFSTTTQSKSLKTSMKDRFKNKLQRMLGQKQIQKNVKLS